MTGRGRIRLLLALSAAAVASFVLATSASAVTIKVTNQNLEKPTTVPYEFDTFKPSYDVDTSYTIRSRAGETTEPVQGISIERLLASVGADITYGQLIVRTDGGGSVRLSKTQITAAKKPVLYEQGGAVYFLRPSSAPSDYNLPDRLSSSGAIELVLTASSKLGLKIKASKLKVRVGEEVRFEAIAEAATAGARYVYTWTFFDGSKQAKGLKVGHTYKKDDTFKVLLTATEVDSGRSDQAPIIEIEVGKAKERKKQTATDDATASTTGAANGNGGSGDATTGGETQPARERKKQQKPQPDLPVVSGQVLSAEVVPLTEPGLAAPSGDKQLEAKNGFPLSADQAAGIFALLVLLFGLLSEFGVISGMRERHRTMRAAV